MTFLTPNAITSDKFKPFIILQRLVTWGSIL